MGVDLIQDNLAVSRTEITAELEREAEWRLAFWSHTWDHQGLPALPSWLLRILYEEPPGDW